jgi:hypothetical protein
MRKRTCPGATNSSQIGPRRPRSRAKGGDHQASTNAGRSFGRALGCRSQWPRESGPWHDIATNGDFATDMVRGTGRRGIRHSDFTARAGDDLIHRHRRLLPTGIGHRQAVERRLRRAGDAADSAHPSAGPSRSWRRFFRKRDWRGSAKLGLDASSAKSLSTLPHALSRTCAILGSLPTSRHFGDWTAWRGRVRRTKLHRAGVCAYYAS